MATDAPPDVEQSNRKPLPKNETTKDNTHQPSVWISVLKWLFGIVLSLMVLTSVITSKIYLISIGTFYNNNRTGCHIGSDIEHSKETAFIMMLFILMIPQLVTFVRVCWKSVWTKSIEWPGKSALFWTVFAAILEAFGLSFFTVVVVLKRVLSAAHCVVIMNSIFLCPILWHVLRMIKKEISPANGKAAPSIRKSTNDKILLIPPANNKPAPSKRASRKSIGLLISSLIFVLLGVSLFIYDVVSSSKDDKLLKENIGVLFSLLLVSIAWTYKIQELLIHRKKGDNQENISSVGRGNEVTSIPNNKNSARDMCNFISGLVKLFVTPCAAFLLCWTFSVANLENLHRGFQRFDVSHPAFSHFMAQIFVSFAGRVLGWLACAMCMQRLAFFVPMLLSTPISVIILVFIPGVCCTNVLVFECSDVQHKYLIPAAVCLWLAQFLSTFENLWKEQTIIMAKDSSLFLSPIYNGVFLEQNLILSRKNLDTRQDESEVTKETLNEDSRVYICTTMYKESEKEMGQLLNSISNLDTKGRPITESHIFFDGAIEYNELNEYALQLIDVVKNQNMGKIDGCTKMETAYGIQLKWKLAGGMPFYIHLKDNLKVRSKKRWSQVMYMKYVINYKEKHLEEYDRLSNAYILATDADVLFTNESVEALLELMMRDSKVGAVCGRTHPLGSGPVFWYQIFDYAIGHWFLKVANHVLGSVLCAPGCFSIYRVAAIKDILKDFASSVKTPIDFLTKDMGEDRWMSTLFVQKGWRLEYCAAAEDSTCCPESFDEFFKQRHRWIPSTLVNLIELIRDWKTIVKKNDKISILFILYQALLVASTLISPATVILVVTGGLKYSKMPGSENDLFFLIMLCIIAFGYGIICLYTNKPFQLKVAKILTFVFALLMASVTIGIAEMIAVDLSKRSSCENDPSPNIANHSLVSTTSSTASLPVHCTDGFPADVSTLYLAGLVGINVAAALMHPNEAKCLLHGIWYLFCLPTGYLLLIIYSFVNITDSSWGTREKNKNMASSNDTFHQVLWKRLKNFCTKDRNHKGTQTTSETNEFNQEDHAKDRSHKGTQTPSETDEFNQDHTEDRSHKGTQTSSETHEFNQEDHAEEKVETWLNDLGLGIYWDNFKQNKYTEPSILKYLRDLDISALQKELKEKLNIRVAGDVRKLIISIKATKDSRDELKFWEKLRNDGLTPEKASAKSELMPKLKDLRNSFLTVLTFTNVIWILFIVTLEKQNELKFKGTNAIGLAFLFIYGFVVAIQFLAMIWHRLSTLCHFLARAKWKGKRTKDAENQEGNLQGNENGGSAITDV